MTATASERRYASAHSHHASSQPPPSADQISAAPLSPEAAANFPHQCDPATLHRPLGQRRSASRLIGLDMARGIALIGMIAVHTIEAGTRTGDMSLAWTLAAGKSAALFALLGGVFGVEDAAARLADELRAALAEAAALRATLADERVLYLIWREPWMTIARDTYIAATLAAVGWHTLPAVEGGETGAARYPAFDWDASWLAGVERVLLSTEPYRFRAEHLQEVEQLAARPALLVDGEMVSWYGSRAALGLRWLCALRRSL